MHFELPIRMSTHSMEGDIVVPEDAKGIVLFACVDRLSAERTLSVAETLRRAGFATLSFGMLTAEESVDSSSVVDIDLLVDRLLQAKRWIREQCGSLPIAYHSVGTGAAAALQAAAQDPQGVFAVACRSGRPDLALASLPHVAVPVLLLLGAEDEQLVPLNRAAGEILQKSMMVIVPGADSSFSEDGALDVAARYILDWFLEHLPAREFTDGRLDVESEFMEKTRLSS